MKSPSYLKKLLGFAAVLAVLVAVSAARTSAVSPKPAPAPQATEDDTWLTWNLGFGGLIMAGDPPEITPIAPVLPAPGIRR